MLHGHEKGKEEDICILSLNVTISETKMPGSHRNNSGKSRDGMGINTQHYCVRTIERGS